MKEIYIVLTNTGTILSKIIKLVKNDEYQHVSIALSENLKPMYSFGRLNPYNPFWGGFVEEGIDVGTFKRFSNTYAKIIRIKIQDDKYEKIKKTINKISKNRNSYSFDILGLLLAALNIKKDRKNHFYCADFIKYVLESANVEEGLPKNIRPIDFDYLSDDIVYMGKLRDFKYAA